VGALDKHTFSLGCNDRLAAKQGTVKRTQKYQYEVACELQRVRWEAQRMYELKTERCCFKELEVRLRSVF
jgi:hypothetical protein